MLLADVVATSTSVAATSARNAKRDALADLLRRLDATEVVPTVGFLTGEPRQGRIGVGWRTLQAVEHRPAEAARARGSASSTPPSTSWPCSAPAARRRRQDLLARLFAPPSRPRRRLVVRYSSAASCARVPSPG
ncbi:MAG: hypothetical protein R2711_05650 [Acidimicrobiales bacterium]